MTSIEPAGPLVGPRAGRAAGRVLIVDDDEVSRLLQTYALRRANWVVAEASTGREGVAVAAETLPEVIICDRMLPDIDGIEVIAALAQHPSTASIPVVLVTALGGPDDIVAGIDAGAHDYLVKPFQMAELEVRCRAALRVSRQHRLLARSEAELRVLTENTTELVVRCSLDGVIRYVSPSARQLLGREPGKLIGHPAAELYHPDDITAFSALEAAQPDQVVSLTRRVLRADGSYIWVDTRAQIIEGPDGDDEVLAAGRDITDRLAQQRALVASERRWRAAFELAPVGMAQIGVDGQFQSVNAVLCGMVGYTAEQLETMNLAEISHPGDAAKTRQAITDVIAGTVEHFRDESRYLHTGGRTVWCAASAVAVPDGDGHFDHILLHCLDISELKRLETELQHLARHDPLTGLLNRRAFDQALAGHVAHVDRYGPGGALLVIDLDGLKVINDTCGHYAGDTAITAVADILRRRLRATDTIARLGGDEYAVIIPHANHSQATQIAGMLVSTIHSRSATRPVTTTLTASIGVAMFDTPGRTPYDVMSEADQALYAAKNAGRDRIVIFGPDPDLPSGQPAAA